jgi:hypothetical protein
MFALRFLEEAMDFFPLQKVKKWIKAAGGLK